MPGTINSTYIADSVFGTPLEKAQAVRGASFQDWLNQRRASVEKQRTDDIKMAKYNALGNALTTLVQPLGWAMGGRGFAGMAGDVQPYDNRQYLESFNRAVKANDDLRNIGDMEAEYQFKLADENYRRELALADEERKRSLALQDYENKQKIQAQMQAEYAKLRHDYTMAEIEARGEQKLDVERLKQQYRVSKGGKTSKDLQQIFYERAATAWANYVSDYRKKSAVPNVELKPMMTQDEFLKDFALKEGYSVNAAGTESGSGAETKPAGKKANPMGGGETTASGKKKNPMN